MLYLFLYWIIYAISDGVEEAKVFEYKGVDIKWHTSIHYFFTLQRAVVWGCFASMVFIMPSIQQSFDPWKAIIVFLFSCILCFPFFHDGAYYQTRHYLDKPAYNWFSQSTTTNAKISLSPILRTWLALASILFMFLLFWDYSALFDKA